jgi:carbonic anhydrase
MRIRNQFVAAITFSALWLALAGGGQEQHVWDYGTEHGPNHWGQLRPDYALCMNGHHQSPIDIRNPQKADLPSIEFDYKPSPLSIIDNGHSIQINYAPGSFISVGGKKYELKQFHFHRPSEEMIDGKTYEMGLHLVHADEQGKLAVVAVLLERGKDNPLIHELWNDLPKEKEKEEKLSNVEINASRLLPANRGYYTFSGSLTTPPCSEDVTWYILKQPVTVTEAEIERFSKLYRNNERPPQPLYDRVVMESK